MRRSKLSVLISLFLSVCFVQCSPTKGGVSQGSEMWHGRWQWEETRFVSRGGESVTGPDDLGIEMEIELLPNGIMKVFHNRKLVQDYAYEVKPQSDFLLLVPKLDRPLTPTIETGILRCSADKLEIVGGYNDAGGNQLFRRIK